jgi:hypothetical protein
VADGGVRRLRADGARHRAAVALNGSNGFHGVFFSVGLFLISALE